MGTQGRPAVKLNVPIDEGGGLPESLVVAPARGRARREVDRLIDLSQAGNTRIFDPGYARVALFGRLIDTRKRFKRR